MMVTVRIESEHSTRLISNDVAQRWRAAHIVDSADFQTICRVGENESDLSFTGEDLLP